MGTLDPTQKTAATWTADAQLVLAGPGSGKTTTLTGRFYHLVRQGIDPTRILALTFTKKAADEMKARIVASLALSSDRRLTVATFHGFAFRHLRRNPEIAELKPDFQLWDVPQQRQVFAARKMWWNEDEDILDIIGGAKERLLDASRYAAQIDPDDEVGREAVQFFQVYERALRSAGAIDFADMVPRLVAAMDRAPAYATTVTGAFDHLLVDEFQDVNPGQIALIDRFVRAGVRLWVVGDDDQTLYAFRAADVRFILDFTRKHRGATVHVLDRNYRSAKQIVAAARRLIAHNRDRRDKSYAAVSAEPGEIVIRGYRTAEIEARQIARAVARLLERGYTAGQIAVLYRTGTIGLAHQRALQELKIPYEVRGSGDLWQSAAARLVVGSLYYLEEGASPNAMSRMGNNRRAEIVRRQLDEARGRTKLGFATACRLARDTVARALPKDASDRERAEWASVVEVVTALASSCRSLAELEQRISEQSSAVRKVPENAVVLSTIHSAKGLEWEAVFLVGMEDGVLPHAGNDDREEERRVAYVGLTRAKSLLGLSYAAERYGEAARPSPFLRELNGGDRRWYIWTSPQSPESDERLALLSNRERERLNDGCLPEPQPKPTATTAVRSAAKTRPKPSAARATKTQPSGDKEAARQGHPWSAAEERQLQEAFKAGRSIASMAKTLQRKKGAVRSRLAKLGVMEEG
ncbi:MAG: ATP-dependent helicase [Hyphomicrobiales bacterium]|nr:ATP-dependent helicase [Hyphomicrobiales bacterium]